MTPGSAAAGKKKVKGPEIPKDETLEETEARMQSNPMKLCIFQVRRPSPRVLHFIARGLEDIRRSEPY